MGFQWCAHPPLTPRMFELIFEVIPEIVLQLFVLYRTKEISWVIGFSIFSSVVSAAYITTDCTMMFERSMMVSKVHCKMRGGCSNR